MARTIKQPPPDPAVTLAKHVKQLVWWHRMPRMRSDTFRCEFDSLCDQLADLAADVLTYQTPSLFAAIPEEYDYAPNARNPVVGTVSETTRPAPTVNGRGDGCPDHTSPGGEAADG